MRPRDTIVSKNRWSLHVAGRCIWGNRFGAPAGLGGECVAAFGGLTSAPQAQHEKHLLCSSNTFRGFLYIYAGGAEKYT